MYEFIFRLTPKIYRKWMGAYLNYADIKMPVEKYVGFSFLFGLVSLPITILLMVGVGWSIQTAFLFGLGISIIFELIIHFIPVMKADSRANFTDEILPDALRLMSANIRSGLTPDRALMLSARPEFGPLEESIRKAAKKTLAGEPLEEAILVMPKEINSESLARTINLLSEGIARGGNLSQLLDGLADDIKEARILKKEISAHVMLYVLFIFFAVGFGAPLLYGISTFLVETMLELSKAVTVEQPTTQFVSFNLKALDIKPEFLIIYSVISITVTSIFGSLLIGLVQEGTEKAGIKYIPVLLIIGLGIFFLSRNAAGSLVSLGVV